MKQEHQPLTATLGEIAAARDLLEREGFLVLNPAEAGELQRALNLECDCLTEIREMTMRSRRLAASGKAK